MSTLYSMAVEESEAAQVMARLRPMADREIALRSIPSSLILALVSIVCLVAVERSAVLLLDLFRPGLACLTLLCVGRVAWSLSRKRLDSSRRAWAAVFHVSAGVSAIIWGLFVGAYLVTEGLDLMGSLLVVTCAGVGAGAVISLAPSRALSRFYVLAVFTPLACSPLARPELGTVFLTGMALLYCTYLIVQAGLNYRSFWQLLMDRHLLVERTRELEVARQRAVSALNARGEFLANVSHEIRTPMNGILGMTSLALGTELNEEQREYLEIAQSSGESLLALLNDILDLSKIEAGKLLLENRSFSPRILAEETLRVFQIRHQREDLVIHADIDDRLPETVIGDAGRLRQALVNLLGNAVKFTERGEIRLVVRGLGVEDDEVRLFFAVQDTGPGIEPEKKDQIFEAFAQADASVTRMHGGTGLGLTITTQLVKLMGGEIQLDSAVGEGSTFLFTARFQCASEFETTNVDTRTTEFTSGPVGGPDGRPIRVLVAEDNAVNLLLIERALSKRGISVVSAGDGNEAIEAWSSQEIDLILMDVQMPGTDGIEATRRIRALEGDIEDRVPIIALTAHAMSGDRDRCIEAGMDEYLSKPVNISELIRTVAAFAALRVSCQPVS